MVRKQKIVIKIMSWKWKGGWKWNFGSNVCSKTKICSKMGTELPIQRFNTPGVKFNFPRRRLLGRVARTIFTQRRNSTSGIGLSADSYGEMGKSRESWNKEWRFFDLFDSFSLTRRNCRFGWKWKCRWKIGYEWKFRWKEIQLELKNCLKVNIWVKIKIRLKLNQDEN